MRYICSIILLLSLVVSAQELTPRYRSGDELNNLNDAVEHLSRILTNRPHPQDLADMIWASLPKKKTWKPAAIRADYVREDSDDEFWLEVLDVERDQCWLTCYSFKRKSHGGYRYTTYTPNIHDRLSVERDFWSAEGATFPPPVKLTEVQALYQRFCSLDRTPELIRFSPTSRVMGRPDGSTAFSEPLVGGKRDAAFIRGLSSRWSQNIGAPYYIGETIGTNSKMLYVDDGDVLWSFLWKKEGRQLVLADYGQAERDKYAEIGKARLCTVPIKFVHSIKVGAGNALPITESQSNSGQLLIRFFRLMKLNNKNECFAYFDAAVSRNQREQWWLSDKDQIAVLQLSQIMVTQQANGQIIVSYPAASGQRMLRCSLSASNRLTILAVNVGR